LNKIAVLFVIVPFNGEMIDTFGALVSRIKNSVFVAVLLALSVAVMFIE